MRQFAIYQAPCFEFWSLNVNPPMTRSGRVATLEEAKAQFQKSWDAWKAWAKLEEVDLKKEGARGWAPDKEAYHFIVERRLSGPPRVW
jgi:hypothetical protein